MGAYAAAAGLVPIDDPRPYSHIDTHLIVALQVAVPCITFKIEKQSPIKL